jgi:glycosyltransferase involved in cell wall biosynthesis
MRILVVSNLYPPHYLGGYELGCQEAVEGLQQRGHDVRVLTSTYGVRGAEFDGEIYRWLETDLGRGLQPLAVRALRLLKKEARNQGAFKRIAKEFRPDVVYLWNLAGISISIAFWAQRMNIPVCFYVFDQMLEKWRQDQWYALWPPSPRRTSVRVASRGLRSLLEKFGIIATASLDLRHVQFASHFLKRSMLDKGEPVADGEVIHWGIEIEQFPFRESDANPERLLLAGQIGPHKGTHTAIEALKILVHEHGLSQLTLTITGRGNDPAYEAELHRRVSSHGLAANVRFTGFVPREQLTEIYRDHGLLLFPSVCDEGLGISLLEAMASGLAVVGTASGGSAEILEHEKTGLVFPKEDAPACAAEIIRLVTDRQLFERVRRTGRRIVTDQFTIDKAIDNIERSLRQFAGAQD